MLRSFATTGRIFALLGSLAPFLLTPLALAQGTQPLTAAKLQKACADTQAGIGAVSVNYTYKDWEGISRTQPTSFAPARCITNQVDFSLVFTKTSGAAPAFEILIEFVKTGANYNLRKYPDAGACATSMGGWIVSYWKGQGAQFAPSTYDAMRSSATNSQCPSLIRAVTDTVVKRINNP